MNPVLIIFTTLNIVTVIINIISIKHFNEIEKYIDKKTCSPIVPVVKQREQISEEDMKKIRELLKDAKPVKISPAEDESKKCACDHIYNKVCIDYDVKQCCERIIFRCEYCDHEEIIPIQRGLLTNFVLNGGC